MASNNGKRPSDAELFDLLDRFQGMMHQMVRGGVKFHSFEKQVCRMYVSVAVDEAQGNYCKAAEKIGLHRNTITRIMNGRRVREYDDAVQSKGSGQTDGE